MLPTSPTWTRNETAATYPPPGARVTRGYESNGSGVIADTPKNLTAGNHSRLVGVLLTQDGTMKTLTGLLTVALFLTLFPTSGHA